MFRRLLVIVSFFITLLFAEGEAPLSTNGDVISEYKKGLLLFKNKEYVKSYEIFLKLFENNLNDPNVNFYLGRSAFEIKRYDAAIRAYERVLFEKPDNIRTKLEMARTFLLSNSIEDAKALFTEIKNTKDIPENLAKIVDKYLEVVESKVQRHSLTGIMIAGLEYDDNTNSKSDHEIFDNVYIPALDTYLDMNNTTDDDSAAAVQLIGLLNYAYKINDNVNNKHDLMLFSKKMTDSKYKNKNVNLISYTPGLSVIHSDELSVDYALFADNMWLDDVDTLRTFGAFPKLTYKYNDKMTIKGHLKYQIKRNQKTTDKGKDSTYKEMGTSLSYIYSKKFTATLGAVLSNEDKKNINTEVVDNDSYTLSAGGNYIYSNKLFIAPALSYKETKYNDIEQTYLKFKKNEEYKAGVTATYIYSPKAIIQAGVNYTKQNSNIKPDVYNKSIYTVNFVRPF